MNRARRPRLASDHPAQLLGECVRALSLEERPTGFYAAIDGAEDFSLAEGSGLRAYGPREFVAGFHALWIFTAVNLRRLPGPVTTFGDPQFGLHHALQAAATDLERQAVSQTVVAGWEEGFAFAACFKEPAPIRNMLQLGARAELARTLAGDES